MPGLVNKVVCCNAGLLLAGAPNSSNLPHSNATAFGVQRALGKFRAGIRAIPYNLMQNPMQN